MLIYNFFLWIGDSYTRSIQTMISSIRNTHLNAAIIILGHDISLGIIHFPILCERNLISDFKRIWVNFIYLSVFYSTSSDLTGVGSQCFIYHILKITDLHNAIIVKSVKRR